MTDSRTEESIAAHLLLAPFRLRTWTNLVYLTLAFPFGLVYFIAFVVGISLGVGLLIVWIGLPILALVFGLVWLASGLERQLAISLLGLSGAQQAFPDRQIDASNGAQTPEAERSAWRRFTAFLSRPTTWSGLAYLTFIKFPFGVVTFVLLVVSLATSVAFLVSPIAYSWGAGPDFGMFWLIDTWIEAWLCSLIGVVLLWGSLNLLNGVAALWRVITGKMLGLRTEIPVATLPEPAQAG